MKRMIGQIIVGLAVLSAGIAGTAMAGKDGTRGGGKAVLEGYHFALPDLLDPKSCKWVHGSDLLDGTLDGLDIPAVPEAKATLAKIAALDWYFEVALEREIRSLDFCFTTYLRPYITEDDPRFSHMTPYYFSNQVQAGIRDEGFVFANLPVFKQMDSTTRVFFLIHETMHSFVDMDDHLHNTHVRYFDNALSRVDSGEIRSRSLLHAAMQGNNIQFPLTVDALDKDRDLITFILEDANQRRDTIIDSPDLGRLLAPTSYPSASLLAENDASRLLQVESDPMDVLLGDFCETVDRGVIEKVATDPATASLAYPDFCLAKLGDRASARDAAYLTELSANAQSIQEKASQDQADAKKASEAQSLLQVIYDQLSQKKVVMHSLRISISPSAALFSTRGMDSRTWVPVTSLFAANANTFDQLSAQARTISETIVLLAKAGQIDKAIALTSGNPEFYSAFGIVQSLQQLDALKPAVADEKPTARQALQDLFKGFWSQTADRIQAATDSETAQKFVQSFDTSKLGYTIDLENPDDTYQFAPANQNQTQTQSYSGSNYVQY